jgi:hypothetical protein
MNVLVIWYSYSIYRVEKELWRVVRYAANRIGLNSCAKYDVEAEKTNESSGESCESWVLLDKNDLMNKELRRQITNERKHVPGVKSFHNESSLALSDAKDPEIEMTVASMDRKHRSDRVSHSNTPVIHNEGKYDGYDETKSKDLINRGRDTEYKSDRDQHHNNDHEIPCNSLTDIILQCCCCLWPRFLFRRIRIRLKDYIKEEIEFMNLEAHYDAAITDSRLHQHLVWDKKTLVRRVVLLLAYGLPG